MSYLIHEGTHIIKSGFESEQGAKASLTRRWKKRYPNAEVSSIEYFNKNVDHYVTVTNIMTGGAAQILASQQGGCCDPSTERYHCM